MVMINGSAGTVERSNPMQKYAFPVDGLFAKPVELANSGDMRW
ncbi:MAG: hypothetical protein QXI39_00305 [Candidatus Bathyarchaeia archaeon]